MRGAFRARQRRLLGALAAGVLSGAAVTVTRALLTRRRQRQLLGKTVVITGGSRGLGLELGRVYASHGARLVLMARDAGALERARTEFEEAGVDVRVVACDLTDASALQSAVQGLGRIDVLVNNAGRIDVGPLESMGVEDFEDAMQLHFHAPLHAILAALPALEMTRGRIVNIASVGGRVAIPHLLPYSASKFALVGLSDGLRLELRQRGVTVTTVCPGLVRTGSVRHASFKGRHREEYAWFALGDSLPISSMSSAAMAEKIVNASLAGRAHVVVGWQAKLLVTLHGLFPSGVAAALSGVNRLLPEPGGIGRAMLPGQKSEGKLPGWVTRLERRAAERNNEL